MAIVTSPAVAENGSIVETVPPLAYNSKPRFKDGSDKTGTDGAVYEMTAAGLAGIPCGV
jgi:hypothetical protein